MYSELRYLKLFFYRTNPFKVVSCGFYTPVLDLMLSLLIKDLSDFKEPNKFEAELIKNHLLCFKYKFGNGCFMNSRFALVQMICAIVHSLTNFLFKLDQYHVNFALPLVNSHRAVICASNLSHQSSLENYTKHLCSEDQTLKAISQIVNKC